MRPSTRETALFALAVGVLFSAESGWTQGLDRGQLLYENHCTGCHESVVHVRQDQEVHSVDDLRCQVVRWASAAKLSWGVQEIDDVVYYLGTTYYDLVEMPADEK